MASTKRRKLERELRKLEFIIDSGVRGSHLLFSNQMIEQCYGHGETELNGMLDNNAERIQQIISDTLYLPSFQEKRDYIQSLPDHLRSALIYGYFEYIGGNLLNSGAVLH